jgi:hypothetical protein
MSGRPKLLAAADQDCSSTAAPDTAARKAAAWESV